MRPIDADALISEIKKDTEKAIEQDDRVGSFWLGYIAGMVIKQPTIQPEVLACGNGELVAQPEPQEGHWIDKGWNGDWAWQIDGRGNCWRVIECSECGKSVSVESNFCPHCGADMRGEQDGNA